MIPEGYILWYHSHVNPQVAALAEAGNRDNLLRPHPKAYLSAVVPEGVLVRCLHQAQCLLLLQFPAVLIASQRHLFRVAHFAATKITTTTTWPSLPLPPPLSRLTSTATW